MARAGSQNSQSASTNPVYFTNGGGKTYGGTASVAHLGFRDNGNNYYAGFETHGYTPNTAQAIYSANSPFTATTGNADVLNVTVTNNDSLGTTSITKLEVILPTGYSPSGTTTFTAVDAARPARGRSSRVRRALQAPRSACRRPDRTAAFRRAAAPLR